MSRILIVEDNPKNMKLARDILEAKGHTTLEAVSGEDGVRLATEELPDMVLMDIQLPDIDGIDAFERRVALGLEVAVSDTGIGIAEQDQAAVFQEYRQVGGDYTNKQEGTGLGLALTKRFVELHGGSLRLESEPGRGSTFTFTLPRQP